MYVILILRDIVTRQHPVGRIHAIPITCRGRKGAGRSSLITSGRAPQPSFVDGGVGARTQRIWHIQHAPSEEGRPLLSEPYEYVCRWERTTSMFIT